MRAHVSVFGIGRAVPVQAALLCHHLDEFSNAHLQHGSERYEDSAQLKGC